MEQTPGKVQEMHNSLQSIERDSGKWRAVLSTGEKYLERFSRTRHNSPMCYGR